MKNIKMWIYLHQEELSLLTGMISALALYLLSNLSFGSVLKGGIVIVCSLLPIGILYFNKSSKKVTKEVFIDIACTFMFVYAIEWIVTDRLNLYGVNKFYVYYIGTCIFHSLADYLIVVACVESKNDKYYKIHSKLTANCNISYVAGYLAYLGYFNMQKPFVGLAVVIGTIVILNPLFTIILTSVIANTDFRKDFINDKERKEDNK